MAGKRDYYEVLGVPKGSGEGEIKSAYRKLARELHPDRNKAADAAKKFAEVQEAYEVLSDADKRRKYDQFGHAGANAGFGEGGFGGGWSGAGPGPRGVNVEFSDADFGSVFDELFGGGRGGGFGGFGRGGGGGVGVGGGAKARPGKSRDSTADIEVDFMTAALGGKRTIRVDTGAGAGSQEIEVTIPKAFAEGGKLRIRGAGAPGPRGGPAGDLILTVHIAAHPLFKRDGLDISLELPLTIAEATLGASIHVPTPGGSVELNVPAGASSGQKLRLRSQGLKDDAGKAGDLYVIAKVMTPKTLDPKDKAALEAMKDRLPPVRTEGWWGR